MDNRVGRLIQRYFNNQYSRNDFSALKEILENPEDVLEKQMHAHWTEFKNADVFATKDLSEVQLFLNRQIEQTSEKPVLGNILHIFSRVAAVLILPLLLALGVLYFQFNEYLFQKNVYVQVNSPAGSQTSLNLPDGSKVWLNGESSIRYPSVFTENRRVNIEGEVFFKVHSDLEHPFIVGAKDIYVKATGTEFNVSAYKDDPNVNIILKEGKVSVLDNDLKEIKYMQAGYQLQYHKNTLNMRYSKLNASGYTDWIYGKLVFQNAPMGEVIQRMEHWYGVDIEIKDKELEQLHFKATFIHESIDEALKLLQSTATFSYCFDKRASRKDGSYKKARVIITKNKRM